MSPLSSHLSLTAAPPEFHDASIRATPPGHRTGRRWHRRRALLVLPVAALVLTACGSSTKTGSVAAGGASSAPMPSNMAGMPSSGSSAASSPSASDGMAGMAGMSGAEHHVDAGRGLLSSESGYTLHPMLPETLTTGAPTTVRFQILDSAGMPVTKYMVDQTKLLHFYVVRSDLSGYQHLHPQLTGGTWTIPVTFTAPGPYRMYTDIEPVNAAGTVTPVVLSVPFTVPGAYTPTPLPAAALTSTVDGYTVTLAPVTPAAGQATPLTFTVSKAGKPVTDIQQYLDSFAHMTAYQQGTLGYEHLHPGNTPTSNSQLGGPALAFTAEFGAAGTYRLFLQFQTAGALHLAQFTVPVS